MKLNRIDPYIEEQVQEMLNNGFTYNYIMEQIPGIVSMQIYRIKKKMGLVRPRDKLELSEDNEIQQTYFLNLQKYATEVPILIQNLKFFSKAQKKRLTDLLTFESYLTNQTTDN